MENLPLVVLRKIFYKLTNLNEIIRCSLVCKNWRLAYETCKPELLCLYTNNFVPLNKRLTFTNEKVTKYNSLNFTNVKFIDSEITRIHFANIKKFIVFHNDYWIHEKFGDPENSLQSQLNHFQSLEYVEIQNDFFFKSKGEEHLNLPNLKVLILYGHFEDKFVLNTPLLEVFITNVELDIFNFLFPQQLRYIYANIFGENQNDFVNLKSLKIHNVDELNKLLNNDFFKNLPNLKFLFLFYNDEYPLHLSKLESQKRKYNLNDLEVIEHKDLFDYKNWKNYIKFKEQIHLWPYGFNLDFNELINCKVPFNCFEENYLPIDSLEIENVPDQSRLVAFLKKLDFSSTELMFRYGCNLDQVFFDELPSYLSINTIYFYGDLFNRLTDYTFFSKLNFRTIHITFYQLPYQVIWNMLNNPSVLVSHFYKFEQSSDLQTDRARRYDCDLTYHFFKNEDSSYFDAVDAGIDEQISVYQIDDLVRHIEMRLKTKFN